MSCDACIKATQIPWAIFTTDCRGCNARMVSRSVDFHRVKRNDKLDAGYRNILDQLGLTHREVRQAWDDDAINRNIR